MMPLCWPTLLGGNSAGWSGGPSPAFEECHVLLAVRGKAQLSRVSPYVSVPNLLSLNTRHAPWPSSFEDGSVGWGHQDGASEFPVRK